LSSGSESANAIAARSTAVTARGSLVGWLAPLWGFCAFLPVGVMYLNLVLMATALLLAPDWRVRWQRVRRSALVNPVLLMVLWTLVVVVVGSWYPDTESRLFHTFRVALLIFLGLALSQTESRLALTGFIIGGLVAALVVAVHHVWPLPPWALWRSLLQSRNNFSSGNMISMAIVGGLLLLLGIRSQIGWTERVGLLAAAGALALTVVLHAASRNSQLLLVVLVITAVVYRFRSLRAAVAGVLAALVLVGAAWQFSSTTQTRFTEIADSLRSATAQKNYGSSVGVRWRMYQEALSAMRDEPVFGNGLGSWLPHWKTVWMGLDQKMSPEQQLQFADINNPHNDFLLAGMEMGIPGMLILFWLLWRFVHPGWRQSNLAGGITVLLGMAMFTTTLLNAPFRDAALGMTLLWLLAASVAGHGADGDA